MATRSTIGMIQSNGSVIGVYCHSDGYLDHVGAILSKHYRDSTKVKELITLGRNGISILGKEIGEKQDFNKPADRKLSWCLFYGRDRGERNPEMTSYYGSAIDFSREYDNDYGYLFDPESNIWFAFEDRKLTYIPGQSTPLVNAMWKKITSSVATESKQFSLSEIAKGILKEGCLVAKKMTEAIEFNVKDLPIGAILKFKDGETWKVTKIIGNSNDPRGYLAAPYGKTKDHYISLSIEFDIKKLIDDLESVV